MEKKTFKTTDEALNGLRGILVSEFGDGNDLTEYYDDIASQAMRERFMEDSDDDTSSFFVVISQHGASFTEELGHAIEISNEVDAFKYIIRIGKDGKDGASVTKLAY